MIVTLSARKDMEVRRRRAAAERVELLLADHARARGGRYVVFGSVARHETRYDSDFDVLVDFPPALEREARDYAEAICIENGLHPDVHLKPDASPALLERVARDGRTLG